MTAAIVDGRRREYPHGIANLDEVVRRWALTGRAGEIYGSTGDPIAGAGRDEHGQPTWWVERDGPRQPYRETIHEPWVYDDGGRALSGRLGHAGDCVARSIAIARQLPYAVVYVELNEAVKRVAATARTAARRQRLLKSSARTGVAQEICREYLDQAGWEWVPTMQIGEGTTVHLRHDELPSGRLIVRCSKHLTAMVDGIIHDTHDPSRDGTRAVYGYWWRAQRCSS